MPSHDIDAITATLRLTHPLIRVRQLVVSHPGADDDGIWFFTHPDSEFEVQLESSGGTFPFLVETDRHNDRGSAQSVAQAVHLIEAWLGPFP